MIQVHQLTIYVMGMLGDFGGCTEVMSYHQSAILLQTAVVLATPVLGLMNAGWQATWLTHKQLKNTNLRHPSEPWPCTYEINKGEMFSCMLNSPTPCRTLRYLEQRVGGLPHQTPNQIWPLGLVQEPFLYNSQIMQSVWLWHHSNGITMVFPFRWEMPSCMCSWVMLTHLHIHRHPPTYPPCILTWPAKLNFIVQFLWLQHSPPGILVHPHTGACNLLKLV